MPKYKVIIPANLVEVDAPDETEACLEAEEIAGDRRDNWPVVNLDEEPEIKCPHCGRIGTIEKVTHDVTIKQPVAGRTVMGDVIEIVRKEPEECLFQCRVCKSEINPEEVGICGTTVCY